MDDNISHRKKLVLVVTSNSWFHTQDLYAHTLAAVLRRKGRSPRIQLNQNAEPHSDNLVTSSQGEFPGAPGKSR